MNAHDPSLSKPPGVARIRLLCALVGWPVALVVFPLAAHHSGAWVFLIAPWVGAYFVSWLGMLRHELWHGYVSGVDNRRFYRITCFALCLDPDTYRLSHASHHLHVNTEHDLQLYPENVFTDRRRARVQLVLELLFGNLAWELSTTARFRRRGVISGASVLRNLPGRLLLPTGLAVGFAMLAPAAGPEALLNFLLMVWSGSVMTRHNQWLQHLGIFAEGSVEERNLLTRNLRNQTLLERFVNFLNHDDSVAHTYHHTHPKEYTRLSPELRPAPDHLQITLQEYALILVGFLRQTFSPEPGPLVVAAPRATARGAMSVDSVNLAPPTAPL